MDILKISTEWAKGEIFSSWFFVLFWIIFLFASIAFWQLGKTELAKAYIIPSLIAGFLLLIIGLGLIYTYESKISNFQTDYENNKIEFVKKEITYVEKTLNDYKNIVFTGIPVIIVFCSIVLIFINNHTWKASLITTVTFLAILLLVDWTASARLENYNKQLRSLEISIK